MATQWQLECINALSTSPTAWEMFKSKQKNRKMLDQFVNRLFPYKIIKSPVLKKTKNNYLNFSQTITRLKNITEPTMWDGWYSFFNCNIKIKLDIKIIEKLWKNDKFHKEYACNNHFCEIKYTEKIGNNTDTGNLKLSHNNCLIKPLLSNYSEDRGLNILLTINSICLFSGSHDFIKTRDALISDLLCLNENGLIISEKEKKKKPKRKSINALNIGIEIEYDGIETPEYIKKQLPNLGVVSFDSGFDGDSSQRLRENRIRLNGIYGLKGLWCLLEHMKSDCKIASRSSVHMHIDCDYDNSMHNDSYLAKKANHGDIFYLLVDLLKDTKYSLLGQIFEIPSNDVIRVITNNVRPSFEFNTLEYRFCKVNFNYKDFILQMIILIHLTECLKHSAKVNKNLLRLVALASREITQLKPLHDKVREDHRLQEVCVKTNCNRDSRNEAARTSETLVASSTDNCQVETGCINNSSSANPGYDHVPSWFF